MNQLWEWFGKNAAHLRGIAALVVIITSLVAGFHIIGRVFQPDLTVTVSAEQNTVPPDVSSWVMGVADALSYLPSASTNQPDVYARFREAGITNWARMYTLKSPDSIGRIRVQIVNETDHVVPGVRIRLSNFDLWTAYLGASSLTEKERAPWRQSLPKYGEGDGILPELPPIPPRGTVVVMAYGVGANSAQHVSITVPEKRLNFISTVSVEKRWPVSWALRPLLVSYAVRQK